MGRVLQRQGQHAVGVQARDADNQADGSWANLRRKNTGRDEPHNVKYWGLGNEGVSLNPPRLRPRELISSLGTVASRPGGSDRVREKGEGVGTRPEARRPEHQTGVVWGASESALAIDKAVRQGLTRRATRTGTERCCKRSYRLSTCTRFTSSALKAKASDHVVSLTPSSTLGHKQFNQLPGHDYEKSVFGPAVSRQTLR